jgi:PAS domain S-box-containing protein
MTSVRPIRVLLADDTSTVRLLLRRTLESSPAFEVVGEAVDGSQAVSMAEALQPDIVLLDMSMPVMAGLEAIPRIRRCAPAARIIVVSGFAPDQEGARAVEAGAVAFLDKQLRPDELVHRLLEVWRSKAAKPPGEPVGDDFRRAFEHAPLPTAIVDGEGRLLEASASLCRLAGHDRRQLRSLTLCELAHPGDRQLLASALRARTGTDGPPAPLEVRLVRPDGGAVWVALSWAPAATGGRFVVQMVDVTEQRRVERELVRSNADLSNFAVLAAHELKSPLQAISGFAALLERVHGPELDPQAREFLSWIVGGAGRMDDLVEDLLAYCAVDTAEPVLAPVALDDVLSDALSQLEAEVVDRRALVVIDALPVVLGDPAQLVQLVQNLLANALKFVPDNQPPHIHVSAERTPEGWLVTVADNGIGVDDGSSDRIFAMFERLHTRERYKGTGIGLSICKRIVERRGGAIWVEANEPGGSRFRFSVPDAVAG